MKRILLAGSLFALGVLPLGAAESSHPDYVRLATLFKAPLQAPLLSHKVGYYFGGCGQNCGMFSCGSNQRPEFDDRTGACAHCAYEQESGQRC